MSDSGQTGGQQQQTPPAWFSTLDAEHLGHVQSKGWDKLAADAAAVEMVKAHREAQKFIGVPADQLLRLPKVEDADAWKGVWQRLGAPDKPEGYTFEGVKLADEGLTAKLVDTLRAAAANVNMPAPMAAEVAKAIAGMLTGVEETKAAERSAAIADEQAKLKANWGGNLAANMLVADKAAERLGVTRDEFQTLVAGLGGARVAEIFRQIGVGLGEDKFIRDPGPGGRDVMTREQAIAKKAELFSDKAWTERFLKGDTAARREKDALDTLIAGE